VIVGELKKSLREAGQLVINGGDFALPPGLEQIPIGSKFLRVDKCVVVGQVRADDPSKTKMYLPSGSP